MNEWMKKKQINKYGRFVFVEKNSIVNVYSISLNAVLEADACVWDQCHLKNQGYSETRLIECIDTERKDNSVYDRHKIELNLKHTRNRNKIAAIKKKKKKFDV